MESEPEMGPRNFCDGPVSVFERSEMVAPRESKAKSQAGNPTAPFYSGFLDLLGLHHLSSGGLSIMQLLSSTMPFDVLQGIPAKVVVQHDLQLRRPLESQTQC